MGIEGDGIEAIFKVLQLDPGFPHHYMDVHYEVEDDHHGYFELRSCGALMDVEPWGERMVTGMCHTIEDGTFDVTAQAVNPKARVRAVHRPPRVPVRPGAALPVGGGHRRRHRGPPRGRHHHHDAPHHGGHVPLSPHARRHAARPRAGGHGRTGRRRPVGAMTDGGGRPSLAAEASRRRLTAAPGRRGRAAGGRRRRRGPRRGYEGVTVRNVARRAGVAPATAYTYFASKDHLLAEVLWRRMQALPVPGARRRRRRRSSGSSPSCGCSGLFMADDPALAAACTTALLGSGPEVRALRVLFGAALHDRLAAALGDAADAVGAAQPRPRLQRGHVVGRHGPHPLRGRPRRAGRRGPSCVLGGCR